MKLIQILLFLHFSAVVVWVGGMATMHFAVRPSAFEILEPPQRLPFMTATLGRLFIAIVGAILFLLLTGGWMIHLLGGMQHLPLSVHIMLGLGLVMMAIFGHVRFAAYPGLQRAVATQDWPEGARRLVNIRHLISINLVLGFVTIGVATTGRILV